VSIVICPVGIHYIACKAKYNRKLYRQTHLKYSDPVRIWQIALVAWLLCQGVSVGSDHIFDYGLKFHCLVKSLYYVYQLFSVDEYHSFLINIHGLYSTGPWIESEPENWLSWLSIYFFFPPYSLQKNAGTLKYPMTSSYHILSTVQH